MFFVGICCIAFSSGFFIAIFRNWVLINSVTGDAVSKDSALIMIDLCLISIFSGIIGGFLVGRYWEPIKHYLRT